MTNGEKIQTILNVDRDCTEVHGENGMITFTVTQDWWNAEYKESKQNIFDYLTATGQGMIEGEKIADAEWKQAIKDIKADLETNTEKWWYGKNNDCFIKLSDVLETIGKHTKELL